MKHVSRDLCVEPSDPSVSVEGLCSCALLMSGFVLLEHGGHVGGSVPNVIIQNYWGDKKNVSRGPLRIYCHGLPLFIRFSFLQAKVLKEQNGNPQTRIMDCVQSSQLFSLHNLRVQAPNRRCRIQRFLGIGCLLGIQVPPGLWECGQAQGGVEEAERLQQNLARFQGARTCNASNHCGLQCTRCNLSIKSLEGYGVQIRVMPLNRIRHGRSKPGTPWVIPWCLTMSSSCSKWSTRVPTSPRQTTDLRLNLEESNWPPSRPGSYQQRWVEGPELGPIPVRYPSNKGPIRSLI